MSENGPALYGPSGGSAPADPTEAWYEMSGYGNSVDGGIDAIQIWIVDDSAFSGITWGVQTPASWTTFDVIGVVQVEAAGAGNVVLQASYGVSSSSPLSVVGSQTVAANTLTSPTPVTLATGVAAMGQFGQVTIGRDGANPADTYAGYAIPYGVLLRKAS